MLGHRARPALRAGRVVVGEQGRGRVQRRPAPLPDGLEEAAQLPDVDLASVGG